MEREGQVPSRKVFLKGAALSAFLLLLRGSGIQDQGGKELEVCPQPPAGCTIREQSGFMIRGGDPSKEPLEPGQSECIAGPNRANPDEYILDVWTSGEKEGGYPTEANCLLVCNQQPPASELEKICDQFRLPSGVEIYDFKELNMDPGLSYKVNDKDLSLLLSENNLKPEDLRLFFFFYKDLIEARTNEGTCYAIGTMTPMENGSRWIKVSEFPGPDVDKRFHNHEIFKTLSGLERLNWIALHEIGEAIVNYKGLELGEGKELWCDKFANVYHDRFEIIQEES